MKHVPKVTLLETEVAEFKVEVVWKLWHSVEEHVAHMFAPPDRGSVSLAAVNTQVFEGICSQQDLTSGCCSVLLTVEKGPHQHVG